MKNKNVQTSFIINLFLLLSTALILAVLPLQAQPSTAVERQKNIHLQQIDRLDAGWDEASYNMPVRSSAYMKAMIKSRTVSNGLGIYSFKGNVKDAPDQRTADQRLKTLALLLRKATDEMTELSKHKIVGIAGMTLFNNDGITGMSQRKTNEGELKHFKPLLNFLAYTVSTKPLSLRTMNVDCSTLENMASDDIEISYYKAEALTQVAEKLASTSWMASNKHLAYKYLVASLLTIPTFWKYLEPEFFRLVSEGGASTDIIIYVKLHMNREPFILQDSRIWNKAPRFQASQLQLVDADAGSQTKHVKKVELSDKETRVTVRYNVGGREMWYRFDNSLALVDNETKELYPVIRTENNIPLGKTFIVVGCEGKAVEFTFVFPPLKKTLKQFVLDDNLSAPTSEKAKMRFFKKHNIMSDGSGRSPIVIYNLSEFVATGTDKPDALAAKPVESTTNARVATPVQSMTTTRVTTSVPPTTNARVSTPVQSTSVIAPLMDELVTNKRVVKEPKSNGRTAEWTYTDEKLVDGKIFFPSGKLEEQYNYINGVREGDSYQYFETGELQKIWTYKNGRLVNSTGYFITGEIRYKYNYKNGLQDGITYEYDRNGTLLKEWGYANGKKEGKSVEYVSNTKRAEWTYVDGELVAGVTYYPSGNKEELIAFTKGVRDGDSFQYYDTGGLKGAWTYDNGKRTSGVLYYETGEVKTNYSFKNGVSNGLIVSYYTSGKVKQESNIENGQAHGTNKLYFENGNLQLVQNMVHGKQNGELIEYDKNGKVIRKEMYQDNKLVK